MLSMIKITQTMVKVMKMVTDKFDAKVNKLNLCDYLDAHILVTGYNSNRW